MSGLDPMCMLCSRSVVPVGGRIPRHLDMTLGVPCQGSHAPLSHTWDAEMI